MIDEKLLKELTKGIKIKNLIHILECGELFGINKKLFIEKIAKSKEFTNSIGLPEHENNNYVWWLCIRDTKSKGNNLLFANVLYKESQFNGIITLLSQNEKDINEKEFLKSKYKKSLKE